MGTVKTMFAAGALVTLVACQPTIGDAPGIGGAGSRSDGGLPGGGDPGPDSGGPGEPSPDSGPGAPQAVTLSQTTSDQILDAHAIGCVEQDDDGSAIQNRDNSYYRVFNLDQQQIEGDLDVTSVTIGVESAVTPDGGAQPATARLYTLEGALLVANMSQIASTDFSIEPQNQTTLEVPLTASVPAGSALVFELFIPGATDGGTLFFIGSNDLGQTAPGYLRAPSSGCDFIEPTDFETVGGAVFPDIHIVMMVSGTYTPSSALFTGNETPGPAAPRPVSVW
jgi:hypothetical protein